MKVTYWQKVNKMLDCLLSFVGKKTKYINVLLIYN